MTKIERDTANKTEVLDRLIQYLPFLLAGLMFLGCVWVEIEQPELTNEFRQYIYSTVGTTMFYFSMLLNILYGKKYGLSVVKAVVYSYINFRLIFSTASVLWTELDISLLGHGSVASFRSVLLMPIVALVLSKLFGEKIGVLCDYWTPYFFFNHGVVTTACWIMGCCAGRRSDWGVCGPLTGETLFPLQPLIILASIATAYLGLEYAKRCSYQTNGRVYAVSMIFYGYLRYMLELFSDDRRVIWNLSLYSVYSLIMIALGIMIWCKTYIRAKPERKNSFNGRWRKV